MALEDAVLELTNQVQRLTTAIGLLSEITKVQLSAAKDTVVARPRGRPPKRPEIEAPIPGQQNLADAGVPLPPKEEPKPEAPPVVPEAAPAVTPVDQAFNEAKVDKTPAEPPPVQTPWLDKPQTHETVKAWLQTVSQKISKDTAKKVLFDCGGRALCITDLKGDQARFKAVVSGCCSQLVGKKVDLATCSEIAALIKGD